jgi:transcriptional regulator with XRE-family HTH domain
LIGKRVKECRKAKNYTQEQLANLLGTKSQSIHKYEKGIVTNIPSDRLEQLAAYLDCSPAYLLGWTDDIKHSCNNVTPDLVIIKDNEVLAVIEKKYGAEVSNHTRNYVKLDKDDRIRADERVEALLDNEKYIQDEQQNAKAT